MHKCIFVTQTFTGDTLTSSLRVAQAAAKKYNHEANGRGEKDSTKSEKTETTANGEPFV